MEKANTRTLKAEGPSPSFTKFQELPPELRIKIWQHAIPGPRTIIVESPFPGAQSQTPRSIDDALERTLDEGTLEATWRSRTEIPSLLHVNAEARHEALKHYQLSLGTWTAQPRVYVDCSRDTLFFGHTALQPECSSLWTSTKDLQNIRRLAIVPEGAWRVMHWQKGGLKALEKIIFVHETDDLSLGPERCLVEDTPGDPSDVEESDIHTHAQGLQEEQPAERGWRRQEGEVTQETIASLESAMARYKLDPIKERMQAAREELDILMQVLPSQWDREPIVSTAVFQEGPGKG